MAQEKVENDHYFPVKYKDQQRSHFRSLKERVETWEDSLKNPDRFWGSFAKKNIDWFAPFDQVQSGGFEKGDIAWFLNGKLNVSYNCIDRWAKYKPDAIAIIWEGNNPNEIQKITYKELLEEVCRFANVLRRHGVRKGDCVVIYMPMIPQAAYAMLACARIGAPHSVIFAGFSQQAIRDRIIDAQSQYIITADEGWRGNKTTPLKQTVDMGIEEIKEQIKKIFVWKRTGGGKFNMIENRDYWLNEEILKERPYCSCEILDSEDTLFLLYTSGSTGKPKGVLHSQAGYLCYVMATHRYVFDLQPNDIYACVADIGWITGHSYIIYGPLSNGSCTFIFESIPTYPDSGRYWDMIERHKITQFYTAPTAIRALMKYGDDIVLKYDRSSLKILGTVGEPINPEAWLWYYKIVGNEKCPIVDTYWQTETGGIVITPLPGCTDLKPGSATLPFFGIEIALLDKDSGKELNDHDQDEEVNNNNNVNANVQKNEDTDDITIEKKDKHVSGLLVIKRPWPGIARTVYGDHQRYLQTYMKPYPGYYFTGDGASRDEHGYYWITGRVDDVLNVSGHRIGTAEIEAVVAEVSGIIGAAVVGIPHDIKGQSIFVYAIPKDGIKNIEDLANEVRNGIRNKLGAFYTPDHIMIVSDVPRTRSGKIMRRILRKIACTEYDNIGDVTTLANPDVVELLIGQRKNLNPAKV